MQFVRVLFISLCVTCNILIDAWTRKQPGWVIDDLGCVTPTDNVGVCVKLNNCNSVLDLIQGADYVSEEIQDVLKSYACGVDEVGLLKVCCPLASEEKPNDDYSDHRNLKLLPKDCGRVRAWGIYSGNQSNLFEFGWSALLKYVKSGDPYLCGGTLINDRYVLTAAQCVQNMFSLNGVRVGDLDLRTDKDCTKEYSKGSSQNICAPPPQDFVVSIEDAIVHPKYNPRTHEHDVALLRLSNKVDTSAESVSPICLPITKTERNQKITRYTSIGWGATEHGTYSPVLLKVLTQPTEKAKCQSFYADLHSSKVSEKQICTLGDQLNSFCAGDYGGPLMGYYDSEAETKTIQYGIVSIRPARCQDIDTPVIHTNVSSYVGWILNNLKP